MRSADDAPRRPEPKYDVQHVGSRLRALRLRKGLTLETGDSVHFKSELAHRWENCRAGVTTVAWVFSDGLSF